MSEWNGDRLRRLMTATGWDKTTIAAKVGASERAVDNWLADKCRMNRAYARTLTRIENGLKSQGRLSAA